MSNTHEWCGLGVAPQRRFLQDLPVSLIDEWVKRFDAGEAVIIEDVDQLPSLGRAAEYEVLKSQDIASLVAAPIEINGTFAGYLGVDNPRRVGELGVVKSPLVAFASFVSARMKREIAQRQVAELTWNDSLTCAIRVRHSTAISIGARSGASASCWWTPIDWPSSTASRGILPATRCCAV